MNLIAGCEDYGATVVGVLRSEKQKIVPFKRFIKDNLNPSKEFTYIKSHNLLELKSRSVNSKQFRQEVINLGADIVLVGSWGERFKKEIIDLPKLCTINVHPSLLPKYRGPNPYLEVIKNRESETGVTFHLMNEKYDAGPILKQIKVEIKDGDTSKELKTRVTVAAREGIKNLLEEMDNDIIIPIEQNEQVSTYYKQIETKDMLIDFIRCSADDVSAHIRALHPFTKAFFVYKSRYLMPNPYKLSIIENEKNLGKGCVYDICPKKRRISVVCGDGRVLQMEDVKLFGILRLLSNLYLRFRIKVGKNIL